MASFSEVRPFKAKVGPQATLGDYDYFRDNIWRTYDKETQKNPSGNTHDTDQYF
jgi:hypothetical protein